MRLVWGNRFYKILVDRHLLTPNVSNFCHHEKLPLLIGIFKAKNTVYFLDFYISHKQLCAILPIPLANWQKIQAQKIRASQG